MPEGIGPSPESFLPESMAKFNLHAIPEIKASVEQLRSEGEKIPETKEGRVDAHFRRIERALSGNRRILTSLVRDKLIGDYTIDLQQEDGSENSKKIDQLAFGLFESQIQIARRRGQGEDIEQSYGDINIPEKGSDDFDENYQKAIDSFKNNYPDDYESKRQEVYNKKVEQKKSLSKWIDYFGNKEADFYPIWFKYLTLRSLQKMGKRDRDAEDYSKRSASTLQPFPDLSREALSQTLSAIKAMAPIIIKDAEDHETKFKGTNLDLDRQDEYSDEELLVLSKVDQMADKGEFAKLYAHFQGEIERAKREKGEATAGEWIHYSNGSDPSLLCKTLEGKGTEWCTAGIDVAQGQLQSGEFYIYYTSDQAQKPVDPRIAIYLIDGQISEVRGVYGKDQDLELDFVDIAREKYKDFGGSENYEKKDHDMKFLTLIEHKNKTKQELTKDDLCFLYEINDSIEGFGHGADPRVAEIRAERNSETDALIIFECQPSQFAKSQEDVEKNAKAGAETKVYIGKMYPGIFTQISNLEHIYTSFPEGKVSRGEFETTGKSGNQIKTELNAKQINLSNISEFMLQSPEFEVAEAGETLPTVRVQVRALCSDENSHTYAEILARAKKLGLDFLPHETAADLLLNEQNQPKMGEWFGVVSKPFTAQGGSPRVFDLSRRDDGLWLSDGWADPDGGWSSGTGFIFGLLQVSEEA